MWSVGQCLEHLHLANEIYLPAISITLKRRQRTEVHEITLSRFSRWFIRSNQVAQVLVARASAYNVNRIRFKNPFIPVLHFTVGTGPEIVPQHQSRHLPQAETVRQSPGFPGVVAPH